MTTHPEDATVLNDTLIRSDYKMPDGIGVPLRDVFENWCKQHEAQEDVKFAGFEKDLADMERRVMATHQERWFDHTRQHTDEKAVMLEFKQDFKDAVRDFKVEILGLKVFAAKISAIGAAGIVVAGFAIRFF